MQIQSVEVRPISVPLAEPYRESEATIDSFNHVLATIRTDAEIGIGEADFLSLAQHSATTVAAVVDRHVAESIIGMDVFNVERILERAYEQTNLVLSPESTAAVLSCLDLALWDLQGKLLDRPVYELLGGKVTERIEVSFTLSAESPSTMAESARKRADQGYSTIVVKVGRGPLTRDAERVHRVRDAVGPDVDVRVDVNGGYESATEAISAIRAFEEYDIEYVEQPLARGKREATKRIRHRVDTPLVADESLVTLEDAFALSAENVFDVFNVKPTKCGGLHTASKIAAVAESAGTPCLVGGHPQQEIARQASRHFAAAQSAVNCGYANEGPGPASQSLTDHVTTEVVTYEDVSSFDGFVPVPDEPGLGIELNQRAVNRYTISDG